MLNSTARIEAGRTRQRRYRTLILALLSAPALLWGITPDSGSAQGDVWPGAAWQTAAPADQGMDAAKLQQARDYAVNSGGGSGYITRGGYLVLSWGDPVQRYDMKSTTKGIGITALGLALQDGLMSLSDRAQTHHPSLGIPPDSNAATGWLDDITLGHLATQSAGFDKSGGYTSLLFAPGTKWSYSDGGPNWLAEALTLRYGQDLKTLLFERVFTPLGISSTDLTWRDNRYRPTTINGIPRREFGSGINANVDAMARIGYLYLRGGRWRSQQLVPTSFVDQLRVPQASLQGLPEHRPGFFNASEHYGLLWWNNGDGTLEGVPRDAYWAWGLGDSLIVVIPSLDLVVTRAGNGWRTGWSPDYSVLAPFLQPIVASINGLPIASPTSTPSAATATPTPSSTPSVGSSATPTSSSTSSTPIVPPATVTTTPQGSATPHPAVEYRRFLPLVD